MGVKDGCAFVLSPLVIRIAVPRPATIKISGATAISQPRPWKSRPARRTEPGIATNDDTPLL
jgi:hypothetical protein